MDFAAQWAYVAGAIAAVLLGGLAWTVNMLRWPGALALGAALFALGEGAFMLLTGIRACALSADGACIAYESDASFAVLGACALAGGIAGLAGLRRSAAPRLWFAAAGLLCLGGLPLILAPAGLAVLPPLAFFALAAACPRLRYA